MGEERCLWVLMTSSSPAQRRPPPKWAASKPTVDPAIKSLAKKVTMLESYVRNEVSLNSSAVHRAPVPQLKRRKASMHRMIADVKEKLRDFGRAAMDAKFISSSEEGTLIARVNALPALVDNL